MSGAQQVVPMIMTDEQRESVASQFQANLVMAIAPQLAVVEFKVALERALKARERGGKIDDQKPLEVLYSPGLVANAAVKYAEAVVNRLGIRRPPEPERKPKILGGEEE